MVERNKGNLFFNDAAVPDPMEVGSNLSMPSLPSFDSSGERYLRMPREWKNLVAAGIILVGMGGSGCQGPEGVKPEAPNTNPPVSELKPVGFGEEKPTIIFDPSPSPEPSPTAPIIPKPYFVYGVFASGGENANGNIVEKQEKVEAFAQKVGEIFPELVRERETVFLFTEDSGDVFALTENEGGLIIFRGDSENVVAQELLEPGSGVKIYRGGLLLGSERMIVTPKEEIKLGELDETGVTYMISDQPSVILPFGSFTSQESAVLVVPAHQFLKFPYGQKEEITDVFLDLATFTLNFKGEDGKIVASYNVLSGEWSENGYSLVANDPPPTAVPTAVPTRVPPTPTPRPVVPTAVPTAAPTEKPAPSQPETGEVIRRENVTMIEHSPLINVIFDPAFPPEDMSEFFNILRQGPSGQNVTVEYVGPGTVPPWGAAGNNCYSVDSGGYCVFAEYPSPGSVKLIIGPHGDWKNVNLDNTEFYFWGQMIRAAFARSTEEFFSSGDTPEVAKPLSRKYLRSDLRPLKVIAK